MATRTLSYYPASDTVDHYKAWAMEVGAALAAFGWSRQADAGAVSWAGINSLPGAGVFRDWEVFAQGDAVTPALYVKVEYTLNRVQLSVGTGDTAGVLSNALGIQYSAMSWSSDVVNLRELRTAGASDWFTLAFGHGANDPQFYSIERLRNADGGNNSNGWQVSSGKSGGWYSTVYLPSGANTGDASQGSNGLPHIRTGALSSLVYGAKKGLSPVYPFAGNWLPPGLGFLVAKSADVVNLSSETVTAYGASHTYTAYKTGVNSVDGASTTGALLVRYE